MNFPRIALCLAALSAIGGGARAEDAGSQDGKLAFNNACRTCHTVREGDNRLGPSLHNVVGRKSGALSNYNYSYGMKTADLVWDKATLDRFIADPDEVVPGNRMLPFGGIASAEERAKIISFLEANSRK